MLASPGNALLKVAEISELVEAMIGMQSAGSDTIDNLKREVAREDFVASSAAASATKQ